MAETLTSLIDYTRRRCNMEGSLFVTDAEITHYLNDEIKSVYAKMINVDDGSLFATPAQTLTSVGNNAYALPSDYLRLVDVNIFSGSRWVPAEPADAQEYFQLLSATYTGDYDTRYFVHLNLDQDRYELFLFPMKAADSVGVRYIQAIPELSRGSDTLNFPSNWHVAPCLGAAVKCLVKEESDPTALMLERDAEVGRILKDIRSQKVAQVKTLRDIGNRSRSRHRFALNRIY